MSGPDQKADGGANSEPGPSWRQRATIAFGVLGEVERVLLATIMFMMVALYFSAVVVRSIVPEFARNVAWIDEATRYLLVWVVFLGLGLALAEGRHVSMSVFLERMPAKAVRWVHAAIDIVGLIFSVYVVFVGIEITRLVMGSAQRSPTLGISSAVLYAILPIGFSLLALRYTGSLFGLIDRRSPLQDAGDGREHERS